MTLDDYIRKYGNESGTKRYNGMQKLLISRQKTCDAIRILDLPKNGLYGNTQMMDYYDLIIMLINHDSLKKI